jgi:hypothetical protein
MKEPALRHLNGLREPPVLEIEEMERRLESQILDDSMDEDSLCVWYACLDVCPPGG